MAKTTYKEMRLAIAGLRRTPFNEHVTYSNARADIKCPPMPVPYIADDGRVDVNLLEHAQINVPITSRLDPEVLKCQICGLDILEEDDIIFMRTRINIVFNDNIVFNEKDMWYEMTGDEWEGEDDSNITLLASNVGPTHVYCGRISIEFCPHLHTKDHTEVVAWRSQKTNSVDALYDDDALHLSHEHRDWSIIAAVRSENQLRIPDLDAMIAKLKAESPS